MNVFTLLTVQRPFEASQILKGRPTKILTYHFDVQVIQRIFSHSVTIISVLNYVRRFYEKALHMDLELSSQLDVISPNSKVDVAKGNTRSCAASANEHFFNFSVNQCVPTLVLS